METYKAQFASCWIKYWNTEVNSEHFTWQFKYEEDFLRFPKTKKSYNCEAKPRSPLWVFERTSQTIAYVSRNVGEIWLTVICGISSSDFQTLYTLWFFLFRVNGLLSNLRKMKQMESNVSLKSFKGRKTLFCLLSFWNIANYEFILSVLGYFSLVFRYFSTQLITISLHFPHILNSVVLL